MIQYYMILQYYIDIRYVFYIMHIRISYTRFSMQFIIFFGRPSNVTDRSLQRTVLTRRSTV